MIGKHHILGLSFALLGITAIANAAVDCQQTFPDVAQITPEVLTEWAKFAAIGAYHFDHQNPQQQLDSVKACFTDAGWKSFQDALQQSNNLQVVTNEKLKVTSQIKNETMISILPVQPNTWKIQVPLSVKYENESRHLDQQLTADLLVESHANSEGQLKLGITQFITKPAESS